MIELKEVFLTFMCSMGATQLSESSKKYFRRKLEVKFGDLLQFEDLFDNGKLFIIPNNLSKLSLAREVAQLSRELKINVSSGIQEIQKTSLSLREAVLSITTEYTWPPDPSQLCESAINIRDELKAFLYILLIGKTGNPVECAEGVHRLRLVWARHNIWCEWRSPKATKASTASVCCENNDKQCGFYSVN